MYQQQFTTDQEEYVLFQRKFLQFLKE